jgi:hypothetical protein
MDTDNAGFDQARPDPIAQLPFEVVRLRVLLRRERRCRESLEREIRGEMRLLVLLAILGSVDE